MDVRSPLYQNIALILAGVLFLNPIVATAAQLAVDQAAGGNTSLTQAGNGVPVVNIATPNGSGLSHNKFTDYNVDQQGLILNNATDKLQSTQLGGLIIGNSNLKNGAAGLILNEVTGANASQLKGYTEVAGRSAAVIVANPHGITCDGCGFINTPRVTLTTGTPVVEGGRLQRFDVDGGQISIEGQGLNADNVDQFDLITRSAKINAELYAKKLNIVTGRNQVDATTLAATAKADDGSDKPLLAIDSSALGGMYAGAIRLVGTEQGVGVKLAGDMAASAGDIQIDANGKLSLAQTSANGNLAIEAGEVDLTGKTYAAGKATLGAQGQLKVQQSLAAAGDVRLKAGQVVNEGVIEAGVKADNSRTEADLSLEAQQVRNAGTLIGNRQLQVKASQRLDNQGGTLSAKTLTRVEAAQVDNRQGRVLGDAAVSVTAQEVDNRSGQMVAKQVDIAVEAEGALDNRQGTLFAEERLGVTAGDLDNSGKGTLASQGSLAVTLTGHLDNHDQGTLISQGSQSISAASVDNSADGLLSSRSSLSLNKAATDNRGGRIQADGALSLNQGSLDNQGGTLSGKESVTLELASLDNRNQGQVSAKGNLDAKIAHLQQANGGELLSQGRLKLEGTRLDNRQGGLIAATEALQVVASEALLNAGGEISTSGSAVVRAQADSDQPAAVLDNSGAGLIVADQGLELYVQRLLNNAKGVLAGRDGLIVHGGSLDNSVGGILSSQRVIDVQLDGALNNQAEGRMLAAGGLLIKAGSIDNRAAGLLSSGAVLSVAGGNLNNQGGRMVSDGQLSIRNSSLNNDKAGLISAGQTLSIETGTLDNQQKGLISGGAEVTVQATQLNNHDKGRIAAKGTVQVTATALDQHAGGELVSESALTLDLQGGDLDNSDKGLIATPGALLLKNLGKVENSAGGEISSRQGFLLKASELNNSAGQVISTQALQLQITRLLNNSLKGVLSGGSLEVKADSLNNAAAGVLVSKGDMLVKLTGKLDNHDQGTLSAAQALTVEAAELDNSDAGLLASGADLKVVTGDLNNQGGSLLSQAGFVLESDDLDNRDGVISSRQALSMTAGAVDNRDNGLITSADTLKLTASRLDSSRDLGKSGGELSAKKDLQLTVTELIQRQGRLIGEAGVRIDLKGGDLDNRGGVLTANGSLVLQGLGKLDNRDGGEISSKLGYQLHAKTIDNGEQGRIISAGQLGLDVGTGDVRNAAGGLISGWQGVDIAAGSLDNSARGTVSSRDGALAVKLDGKQRMLDNSDEGALVSKGALEVEATRLDNSAKGIVSSGGDLDLRLTGTLDNSGNGLIDTQGSLTVNADAVNNNAGQISSTKAASLDATSLNNQAGQLASGAALDLTLTGDLLNGQQGKLASAGPLVLKAKLVDNQSGILISQSLLDLTASSLNNVGGTVAARNGLSLLLTGALNNTKAGLIHSQLGNIGVRAERLDNSAGSLSSQGDLLLTLDGKLDNRSGQLQSRAGNLDLKRATSVDNQGGVLSSLTGWLKLVSTGLFDNDGGTTQAQTLDIEAQGLNNRGGHISALAGNTTIDLGDATFNNQGGGLYAHQLLDVTAGDFNNQGEASGQGGKVAAERIDFGLSGALNNTYGLIESASSLSLTSTSLDNRFGSLRALGSTGDTGITTGSLDNRDGRIETANTNLVLGAASLQNAGGSILHVGTGNFGLSAAQVMGAGGDLSTNGLLSLTADSWINSGVLQAGRLVLNIGNFTQTATGQLLASQSLTGSGGTWINDGLLASDGSLSLDLTGGYSGAGQVTSLGELNLKAASIDLASAARINGGGVSSVSSTGSLTNRGRLTSASGLTVSANTLNNYGTLGSGETLRLVAPNLLNERGLIFSGDDMALRVDNFTNRYGDVYGLGDLSVSRNDANAQAEILENISGTIESLGDMRLLASRVVNRKDAFKVSEKLISGEITYQCLDCKGRHYDFYYFIEENLERSVESDSPAASLVSGKNLTISGVDFENSYSQVSAAKDVTVSVANFTNTGASTSSVIRRTQLRNPNDSESGSVFWGMVRSGGAIAEYAKYNSRYVMSYWDVVEGQKANQRTNRPNRREHQKTNKLNPNYNPNFAYPLPSRFSSYSVVSSTETNTSSGVAANAVIQAGGKVNINASKKLDNGVTRESFDFVAGRSQTLDTRVAGTGKTTVVFLNSQLPPNLQQQQVNPLTLPGFTLPQGENGLFRLSNQASVSINASPVQGVAEEVSQAASLSAVSVAANQPAQAPVTAGASAWSPQDDQSAASLPSVEVSRVAGVQSLPGNVAPPARHKYLIETNPALTDLKQFVSSDYLLGNLGYDPDRAQKRLGDGLYEQRLVREAIVARTGQRYLAGLTSDEAMFRYLMDNAVASKERLGLSLGVTLSAEQVAALTHDIVWLEEQEVAGEKVLVPVLYLSQAKGRLAANGALIQGRDVTLISGGDLVNQGTLRASDNLTATASNIRNSGLVEAGNRLQLLATDSIRNAQGGIIAGLDVSLTALTGDVINERSVTRHQTRYGNSRTIQDFVDSAARIEAANDLSVIAGRDFSNLGGVLDSRGDLAIDAGRDVTISSVEERVSQARGSHYLNERVSQVGAQVSAGRDLDISAGRDLGVIASRLEAGRDVALAAGNDALIASAANESHFLSKSKKVINQRDQVRQQSSEIVAGGDIAVSAKSDLVVSASKLDAGDEAYLVAGENLALLSAEDYDYSLYQKKKKGSFGRKSFKRNESTQVTNVGSDITTGGDLTLLSEGDQLYQRAHLESGNDLTLASGGDITFEGVKDLKQESREKSKSSFAWQSAKGKGKTDETLKQSELIAQGDLVIKAVDGLKIDIKQVNQQSVSQTIDAMVQADPNLAWLKEAEARGDVDWRRVKEVHDSFKYSSSGLGAGAQLVIAIAMAYFAGPMISQGIGSLGGATAAAGSGTAMAASGTATASAIAGGATAGSTVAAGWANVALTAAATGAASNAAVSVINNRGNLGAVLKDVTSSDNLKGYATSAITAGFTSGMLDSAFGVTGDNINKVTKGFDLSKASDIAKFGSYLGAQGAIQAVTQTAIQGGSLGDNLQTALTAQVQHLLQASVFKNVGDFADKANWAEGSPEKVALHAVVGGLLSEATGGDFKTGALAGGANELLIEQLSGVIKGDKSLEQTVSQLIGVAAATATGGDMAKAAELAKNATAYNRQLHESERKALEAEAKRLAKETGKTVAPSGMTWEDLLLLASGAELDALENARLQSELGKYGDNNPESEVFAKDLQTAMGIVQELASRNTPLTWLDGKPIVANGAPVYAFQSTAAQYNDSTLFNDSVRYQKGSVLVGDAMVPDTWKHQFGEREAAQYMSEILHNSTNQSEFNEAFQRLSVVAGGGISDVTWDAEAALMLASGGSSGSILQVARNALARRALAGEQVAGGKAVQEELIKLVAQGDAKYVGSKVIQRDTTVLLTEEALLTGGKVVPKGSIVTVNGDAMKIVQPDGTIIKGSYTKAVADVKALPGGSVEGTGGVRDIPQITLNRQNGTEFERQVVEAFDHVGGVKNTAPITVQLPNGAQVTTIPDLWGKNVGGLLEVKNVKELSMSNQLRAQIEYAGGTGQPLNLVVSPRTISVSEPLLQAVRETGGNVYRYNPVTGELINF